MMKQKEEEGGCDEGASDADLSALFYLGAMSPS